MISLLEALFLELQKLFESGILIYDPLTSSIIRVRAGLVGTVDDFLASSKLGMCLHHFCDTYD